MEVRQNRASKLPAHVPHAYEVARELVGEILSNLGRYKLSHKPVIKVTSHAVYTFIVRRYKLPPSTAVGAYTSYVLAYLDVELERRGYKLVGKIEGHGRVKVRYYQLPG